MYPNFISDQKNLGYEVLRDTSCGIKLVLILDSIVPRLLKPSKCKRQFVNKVVLVSTLWFSNVQPAPAMGLSIPAAPVVKLQPSYRHSSEVKTAPTVRTRLDKIVMMANNHNNHMIPLIYINGHYSYINEQLLKKLRAGDLTSNLSVVVIGVAVYLMFQLSGVDAFGIIAQWNAPTTYLEMEKPASMPQQKYSGMTKSERRHLPDPIGRDRSINVDGYPRLDLRFNQVKSKTPKHGKDHGLPVGSNGKTPKTEANALALRDSLIDMANNQDIIWYTDGQYQGGTQRGYDSVNLFDPNTNIIAVYQKQRDGSCLFLTTCKLVRAEVKHLKDSNGNFLTETMINQQNAISTKIHDSKNTKNDL